MTSVVASGQTGNSGKYNGCVKTGREFIDDLCDHDRTGRELKYNLRG